jgi:hypothetical protein
MYAIGARIYMKPLLPGEASMLDLDRTMQAGKRSLLRRLKGQLLQQTVFSPAAKAMLASAVQVKVKQSSLQVVSSHPGFLPLLEGQKREQMKWLTKARAPIPIVLHSGKLIFRNATPASMSRGAWWHPGRTPTNYVDKAKELTRKFMQERMVKEFEKNLRLRMSGAGQKKMKSR